ncbi:PREDICTED: uncharacterized protein LOC108774501 [Cyphomyrmex costatus]|uniref:uncharacterized protein LOC108774501 n=1 Tax=Cyphomyrmex costatus TaxID=456900 RepID=UPI00085239BA|nr:PREDICTED: uncharacterized protein LOC108774501 [Cyphomyrmex costatus]
MHWSLANLDIWWSGHRWLSLDRDQWPQSSASIQPIEVPEKKSKAYILRFVRNTRKINGSLKSSTVASKEVSCIIPPITVNEQHNATLLLVKLIQSTYYAKELISFSKQGVINKNSPILRLNPFIDDAGVLRVGGRLEASSLSYAAKHPILLPGHHPFSHLIISHEHEKNFHAGAQATLAATRQRYWMTSARNIVRQIVQRCITCFRSAPKPASTIMGNLPSSRITTSHRVFERCGVDYAGPLYHKEGMRKNTKLIKCYMAVFVCMATKAVHLELAIDLSSNAFLNVFKRFIARRGCPSEIFSDNGLNFVGAERELNELSALLTDKKTQQQVSDQASKHGIQWHFIPPRAPHHGGLWEAAVKSAKQHLRKVTKDAHLRFEELETLLIQIEAILNSRPITPLSSDPRDLRVLIPGHFIIGSPLTAYPEESIDAIQMNRLSRWQHVQRLKQHFWKRWTREYLHQLQQRSKWKTEESTIKISQMVISIEDNQPPLSWVLGRIQDVHIGDDGIGRVATVYTTKGTYKRPITRLCLLPIELNDL